MTANHRLLGRGVSTTIEGTTMVTEREIGMQIQNHELLGVATVTAKLRSQAQGSTD